MGAGECDLAEETHRLGIDGEDDPSVSVRDFMGGPVITLDDNARFGSCCDYTHHSPRLVTDGSAAISGVNAGGVYDGATKWCPVQIDRVIAADHPAAKANGA